MLGPPASCLGSPSVPWLDVSLVVWCVPLLATRCERRLAWRGERSRMCWVRVRVGMAARPSGRHGWGARAAWALGSHLLLGLPAARNAAYLRTALGTFSSQPVVHTCGLLLAYTC